jgi:hypothetical protein
MIVWFDFFFFALLCCEFGLGYEVAQVYDSTSAIVL